MRAVGSTPLIEDRSRPSSMAVAGRCTTAPTAAVPPLVRYRPVGAALGHQRLSGQARGPPWAWNGTAGRHGHSLIHMRAVQITRFGGPEVLDVVEVPDPVPGDGQQLYDVSTAGLNFADTHQRLSSN